MFDRYTYISMYLITSVYKHSVIQWFYFIAILEIIMFFFGTISSVSKSKTNGEYYQKSDYRLLRINTLFLIW